MKVKIGIAEADRVIEIEVDEAGALKETLEEAFSGGPSVLWFEDIKHRMVGIPRDKIAFIEMESEAEGRKVGFAPAAKPEAIAG
jgi:hypothetical protein